MKHFAAVQLRVLFHPADVFRLSIAVDLISLNVDAIEAYEPSQCTDIPKPVGIDKQHV